MASTRFKSDWSLSYLLYYLARISAWLMVLALLAEAGTTVSMWNSGSPYMALLERPVTFSSEAVTEMTRFETNSVKGQVGGRISGNAQLSLKKSSIEPGSYLLILFGLLDYAALAFGLFVLARLLKAVAEGEPFRARNVRRLYLLGAMVLLAPFYSMLKQWAVNSLIASSSLQGVELYLYRISPDYLLLGLLILVLGYVFREGARLHEEQKMTV